MNKLAVPALRLALLLCWMGVIFYFSDQPNSNKVTEEIFGSLNYFVRKGAHMTEYAILFLLSFWFQASISHNQSARAKGKLAFFDRRFSLPFLFAVLYAMSDEWHQSFVPGRTALVSDVVIDSCGAAVSWILSVLFLGR